MNVTELTQKIKPFVLGWLETTAGGAGPFAPSPHELNGSHHTGTLAATQYPDALLRDGSRSLTGNLSVGSGITIDGVDISAFKSAYDTHVITANAHHEPVTIGAGGLSAKLGLTGQVLTLASIAHSDLSSVSADQHHAGFVGLSGDSGSATPDAGDLITLDGGNGIITAASGNTVLISAALGTGLTFSSGLIVLNWSGTPNNVNLSASAAGSSLYAAHVDHRHQLDVSIVPTWTGLHTFSAGVDITGTIEFQGAGIIKSLSSGNITLFPDGDLILDPTGKDVLPNDNYDVRLGSLNKKYLSLHCAELWVETLVAQETIATIGGRILVGPTTQLVFDLNALSTTIYVKHNQMAIGDRVYLEADGKVEFIAITSGPAAISDYYSYGVTRDLDGTGANVWYAGDAIFNTGAAGDGFIDLYSIRGVKSASQYGPTIVGNVRNSSTYNDWTEAWAVGNLNGLYGYGVDTYGVGLGKYSAANYITIDSTNGVRFFDSDDAVQAQLSATTWTIGKVAYGFSNVQITSGAVKLRNFTTTQVELGGDGTFFAGASSTTERIQWDLSHGLRIYNHDNEAVFSSDLSGNTWLTSLAISESLGQSVFSAADGLLLLGPGCEITPTAWTSSRGQVATISGAFHQVMGRWPESRALLVERDVYNHCKNPYPDSSGTSWPVTGGTFSFETASGPFVGNTVGQIVTTASANMKIGYAVNVSLTIGETWMVTFWAKATTSEAVSLVWQRYGSPYDAVSSYYNFTITTEWTKYTLTLIVTETYAGQLILTNIASGNTVQVANVNAVISTSRAAFVAGDMGTGYSWAGTAHQSASAKTSTVLDLSDHVGLLNANETVTISAWVQAPCDYDDVWQCGPSTQSAYISDYVAGTDSSKRVIIAFRPNHSDVLALYINNDWRVSVAVTFSAGDWLHIVATLDYTTDSYKLYLNGALLGESTASLTVQSTLDTWMLGSRYNNYEYGGWAFGEFAVMDRVIDEYEVASIYASGRPISDAGAGAKPFLSIVDGLFDIRSSMTGARVQMDAGGITAYSTTAQTVAIETDGDLFAGSDISAAATTALAVFATAQTYNSESVGAGDVLLGDNTAGSANILWDVSEKRLKFRGGTTVQAYIDTDGAIVAGAGAVTLDSDGVTLTQGTGAINAVKWDCGDANRTSGIRTYSNASGTVLELAASDVNASPGTVGVSLLVNEGMNAALFKLFVDYAILDATAGADLRLSGGLYVGSASRDPAIGTIGIEEISSTPGSPASGVQGNIYLKGNKLIIQFNDSGTVRYKYLDLTGTGVTWVHTTSAP